MESGVLEEVLTCAVCLGLYQDPVVLPCQHSFCEKCITDDWDNLEGVCEVSCPQCRMTFNPRPKLVKNHTLNNIVEKYNQRQPTAAAPSAPVMCEYCIETPVPAVKTCLKCETSFCSLHLQPHLKKPIYKDHSLIEPVADLTKRQCPTHKKVLEFYCEEDEECVCMSCSVVGNHKSHTLLSLEQAQDKIKEKLKNSVENICKVQKDWSSEQKDLKQSEIDVKRLSKELKETLSIEFSKWRKQLEEDEKFALKLIDEEENRVLSQIKNSSDSLVKKMEETQIIEKEAQDQDQRDPLAFIQDTKQLLSRYSQIFPATIKNLVGNSFNSSGKTQIQQMLLNRSLVFPISPVTITHQERTFSLDEWIGIPWNSSKIPEQNIQGHQMQLNRTSQSRLNTLNLSTVASDIQKKFNENQKYQTTIMGALRGVQTQTGGATSHLPPWESAAQWHEHRIFQL